MTYLIEYLGEFEFEFIFKIILDYESGDQMGSFDAKKPPSKISCLGTFKLFVPCRVIQDFPFVPDPIQKSHTIPKTKKK